MYLAVYKPFGRYPLLYKFPGALIRRGLLHEWCRPLVVAFAQVPYFLVHFIRSRWKAYLGRLDQSVLRLFRHSTSRLPESSGHRGMVRKSNRTHLALQRESRTKCSLFSSREGTTADE